jgi:hypothetical protein
MHPAHSKRSTSITTDAFSIAGDVTIVDKGRTREIARQIVVIEMQPICRMKNGKQTLEHHENATVTTRNQTIQHSLNRVSDSISLGIVPVKLFWLISNTAIE